MLYKERLRKWKYEETVRICIVLGVDGNVSYDAASEYGVRSHTYHFVFADRLSPVLL